MTKYLLLILLASWALLVNLSSECETGVAFVKNVLSVQRSLMANADVAFLKAYNATNLKACMEDCCSGKYGACSISSFKKNTTLENCLHFNCRPLSKCKFLSSDNTDSFTFSSNPLSVPSSSLPPTGGTTEPTTKRTQAKNKELSSEQLKKVIASYTEELPTIDDNATVKPRKGVEDLTPEQLISKSGIKPRKGVTLQDVPHAELIPSSLGKSNIKARKGVEPYYTTDASPETSAHYNASNTTSRNDSVFADVGSSDLLSALKEVFEDDWQENSTEAATPASETKSSTPKNSVATPALPKIYSTSSEAHQQTTKVSENVIYASTSSVASMQNIILPNISSRTTTAHSITAPPLYLPVEEPAATTMSDSLTTKSQPPNVSLGVELLRQEQKSNDELILFEQEEAEKERKYASSIHLILSLVFGLLVLFAVLGVVAKRVYDSWVRRDYYKMNYLIDGIYNGVN